MAITGSSVAAGLDLAADSGPSLSDRFSPFSAADGNTLVFLLSILTAASFLSLSVESTFRVVKMKSWYLWPLALAAVLEAIGFISSIYYSQHLNNHVVYFVSFATMTLAPSLVSIATIITFGRLVSWVTPVEKKNARSLGISPDLIAPVFVTFEAVAASFLLFAIYDMGMFLSPAKIHDHREALQRLVHYERGISALKIGHILEIVCMGIVVLIAIHFVFASSRWQRHSTTVRDNDSHKLSIMVVIVCCLNIARSAYKILEFSNTQSRYEYLAVSDGWFWLFDVLPILLSILFFCARHPGNFLPQEYTNLSLRKSITLPDSEKSMTRS